MLQFSLCSYLLRTSRWTPIEVDHIPQLNRGEDYGARYASFLEDHGENTVHDLIFCSLQMSDSIIIYIVTKGFVGVVISPA